VGNIARLAVGETHAISAVEAPEERIVVEFECFASEFWEGIQSDGTIPRFQLGV
jgi:hypothetical protein